MKIQKHPKSYSTLDKKENALQKNHLSDRLDFIFTHRGKKAKIDEINKMLVNFDQATL